MENAILYFVIEIMQKNKSSIRTSLIAVIYIGLALGIYYLCEDIDTKVAVVWGIAFGVAIGLWSLSREFRRKIKELEEKIKNQQKDSDPKD